MIIILAVFALFLAPQAFAQSGEEDAEKNKAKKARLIERWKKLSPEQRERFRKLFKHYQNLPEEKKAEIRKRFEKWRALPEEEKKEIVKRTLEFTRMGRDKQEKMRWKRGMWLKHAMEAMKALKPEVRRELQSLPPRRRAKRLHELFKAEKKKRVKALLDKMDPSERKRLMELPEKERFMELKKKFIQKHRKRVAEFLKKLPPEERKRLKELPRWQRIREIKRLIKRMKQKHGGPGERPPRGKRREGMRPDADGPRPGKRMRALLNTLKEKLTPEELKKLGELPPGKRRPFIRRMAKKYGIPMPGKNGRKK